MGLSQEKKRQVTASATILALLFGIMLLATSLQVRNPSTPIPIIKIIHHPHPPIDSVAMMKAVNPAEGFTLPIQYGKVGTRLVESGVIDLNRLRLFYQKDRQALSDQDLEMLTQGSQESVSINQQNADFLEKLFWAVGLANQNIILDQGSIRANGSKLESISSIKDWKLSLSPAIGFFSRVKILNLSPDQQARVEDVAKAVYLPCCDNPAIFPDCSHGMAMLGLLEWMGAQDVSADAMFSAAKQVSSFWFPQQTLEKAIFIFSTQIKNFSDVDSHIIMSSEYSSAKGFQQLDQWLAKNGMLKDEGSNPINCSG